MDIRSRVYAVVLAGLMAVCLTNLALAQAADGGAVAQKVKSDPATQPAEAATVDAKPAEAATADTKAPEQAQAEVKPAKEANPSESPAEQAKPAEQANPAADPNVPVTQPADTATHTPNEIPKATPVPAPKPATPATKPATPATTPATMPATPTTQESAGKDLDACKSQYMRGQYAAAVTGYQALMKQDATRIPAAVGAAQALAMQGKYTEALAELNKAGTGAEKDFRWQLQQAEVLAIIGEYEKALKAAEAADKLNPLFAPTLLVRGQLLETLGRKQAAIDVYNSMSKIIDANKYDKDPELLTALGQIMDRQQVLTAKKASTQAENILKNYFDEAYMNADKGYWPAAVAGGMFCLSKHRMDLTKGEFDAAAKLNPRVPDMYVGMASAVLEEWQFEQCISFLQKAFEINPNHTDALMVKAVCLMQWRRFEDVPAVLDQVLKINPNHLDALSLYAALKIRLYQDAQAKPFMDRVKKINPDYQGLPQAIGEWLSAGRQFKKAEPFLQEAVRLAPENASTLTSLGSLYMQTGQEEKAREYMDKAFKIDDYRTDTLNYLNLLDRLAKFKVRTTQHFIIKVNPEVDAVLLDQVADSIEQVGKEVCSDFAYTPAEKTVVEFFPTQQQFAVRVTGKGWLGTVGASTGTVIAMVAPSTREEAVYGNYHWLTVLRHEYTHTVTLAKSNNRIPHWFTEACAVFEQPDRRNYQATQELIQAYRAGRPGVAAPPAPAGIPGMGPPAARPLFSVKEVDWGFIRPKQNADRSLAYAQSEWMMEYIIATKTYPTILKMIDAFAAGKEQKAVFKEVLGTTEEQFDTDFKKWAKDQITKWGFDPDPPTDLAGLQKQVNANPKDATAAANYAYALLNGARPNPPEAEKWARKALEIDDRQSRALGVLAICLYGNKKQEEALDVALRLRTVDPTSKAAYRILAEVYLEKRQWADAITALNEYKKFAPLDEFSYDRLSKCYIQMGEPANALPNLIELHVHTLNNPAFARQIADLYRSLRPADPAERHKDVAEALKYYREITYINPYDSTAYQSMAMIYLRELKDYTQAVRCSQAVTLLEPTNAEAFLNLAKMELWSAKAQKDRKLLSAAKADAETSDKLEPSDDAKDLIKEIVQAAAEMPATQPSK